MSFFFGDGFELYAATTDPMQGGTYWDSGGSTIFLIVAGRFTGSRALQSSGAGVWLRKASGQNESVHHFNIGHQQTAAISGTTLGFYIQLVDGVTNQCAVVFRSDGAILLTSGGPAGTVLATYTGAVPAANIWNGFEIEVVVHNTAGSISVRKNGNPSNDFSLGSLNTRGGTANNYANQAALGMQVSVATIIDDFLWRSDASSVAWVGDIRCYTRMPASDASVQWTPSGAVVPVANFPVGATTNVGLASASGYYMPFVAPCDGTVGVLSIQCATAATANIKCAIYASAAGAPTTVLGSANLITNPGVGTTTFTFATPVSVSRGVTYYAAFHADASSGTFTVGSGAIIGGYSPLAGTISYASFPTANPASLSAGSNFVVTINITTTTAPNASMVADTQQDAANSYVSSSTVGQTDLYGIAPISATPASVVGVTTRALCQKTDAGTRNIGVQLKSGATTSNGTSTALNTTFGWIYRNDLVDPATGAAWTPTAVNNLQIGELLTA